MTRARGRFFLASFSSALMLVAMIQPSNVKAVATTAVKSAMPGFLEGSTTVVKFSAVMPFTRPTMMPTTAISARGTILMTVVETWNLPARMGEMVLST